MSTPSASLSSPSASLIPVENGKDFAPPVKKFKVDNTDPKAMEFTPEEAFKIWRKVFGEEYSGKDEEVMRLELFTNSYMTTPSGYGWRYLSMADRTEQEIERFREEHCIYRPIDNHISVEDIRYLKDFDPAAHQPEVENEKDFAPLVMKFEVEKDIVGGEEHNTDSVPKAMEFTPAEAFKIWHKVLGEEYSGKDEEVMRLEMFTNSYMTTPSGYGWRCPTMADRTEQEIERFREEHCIYRPIDNHISVEDIRYLKDFDPAVLLP